MRAASRLSRPVAITALLLMLAASLLAWRMKPTVFIADLRGKPDLERLFPRQFGDWVIDSATPVVLPAPDVQARLDRIYNQVLTRSYVDRRSGDRVMLSVAYGGDQSDGTRLHRPEVCYPAQGFQIRSNGVAEVAVQGGLLAVRQLESLLGERHEPITYWMVVGDRVVVSGLQAKLAQLGFGLRGQIPDGLLVRVSSIDRQTPRALAVQRRYIDELSRAIAPDARWRVFGQAAP